MTTSKLNEVERYKEESIQRMKDRLAEIIRRLKEKDKIEKKEAYNPRRKNGQRYYPRNNINPHLPVTTGQPSSSSPAPDDYFTVKDRSMNGSEQRMVTTGCLLLCALALLFQQYHH